MTLAVVSVSKEFVVTFFYFFHQHFLGHSVRLLGQKKDGGRRLGGARLDLPKIRKNPLIEIISINTGQDNDTRKENVTQKILRFYCCLVFSVCLCACLLFAQPHTQSLSMHRILSALHGLLGMHIVVSVCISVCVCVCDIFGR